MALANPRRGLAVAVTVLSLNAPITTARSASPAASDALQVIADIVLIESECRQIDVDYGALFKFAERNGIRPVDIMPTGEHRAAFEAAYDWRSRAMRTEGLCIDLAAEREVTVPGVFSQR